MDVRAGGRCPSWWLMSELVVDGGCPSWWWMSELEVDGGCPSWWWMSKLEVDGGCQSWWWMSELVVDERAGGGLLRLQGRAECMITRVCGVCNDKEVWKTTSESWVCSYRESGMCDYKGECGV